MLGVTLGRMYLPTQHTIKPEQILEMRAMADKGYLAPNVRDLSDIALGHRFEPEEREHARIELAKIYPTVCGPLPSLLGELVQWAQSRRFDDDQDPATDTPDERLVRAFFRWEATAQ